MLYLLALLRRVIMENLMFTPNIKFEDFITDELKELYNQRGNYQHKLRVALNNLHGYDYKTSKYVDGELTEEEFVEVKEKRKQWRKEVNESREKLDVLNAEIKAIEDKAKAKYEQALQDLFGGDINEENDNTNEI